MHIDQEIKLDYKDVLLCPKISTLESRREVNLERHFTFPHSSVSWTGIPIVAANMDTVGTFEVAEELSKYKMLTCLHKHYRFSDWVSFLERNPKEIKERIAVSVGMKYDTDSTNSLNILQKQNVSLSGIKFICIDVANGYTKKFCDFIKNIRKEHPEEVIIAGNVVTRGMAEQVILSGADIVKVGIGSGSVCTTRILTGVGYPQLSAVIECSDAAHGVGGHVMADGGCVCSGDVAKAFGAGADFVMLGGLFAGHTECAGQEESINGIKYKTFYGMSSNTAMERHHGGVAPYRASEGKTTKIQYRGPIKNTIDNLLGGLRSACTYIGARTLKSMPKCSTFVRVSQQSNEIFGRNI